VDTRALGPLIGEWSMEALFPNAPPTGPSGRTTFEWMNGEQCVIQRWEVAHPAAPDGIAVIGVDERRGTYLQHYFDSRGVARVYEMEFGGGLWKLSRTTQDFSPLDFAQRFTARVGADRIDGRWEIRRDGSEWEFDFELIYRRA